MSENVDNLVLEHLRSIRAEIARMADGQDTIRAELLVVRQHLAGMVGSRDFGFASSGSSPAWK